MEIFLAFAPAAPARTDRRWRIGVDRTTYAKYETGDSEPNFETLLKITEIFDVSTDYLLGRTDQKETPTPVSKDGLSAEQLEILNLYDAAPPALQAAALAVLKAAEGQEKAPGGSSTGE